VSRWLITLSVVRGARRRELFMSAGMMTAHSLFHGCQLLQLTAQTRRQQRWDILSRIFILVVFYSDGIIASVILIRPNSNFPIFRTALVVIIGTFCVSVHRNCSLLFPVHLWSYGTSIVSQYKEGVWWWMKKRKLLAGETASCYLQYFWHLVSWQLPSVLWHCWLDGRKGIRPVKKWGMVEVGTG